MHFGELVEALLRQRFVAWCCSFIFSAHLGALGAETDGTPRRTNGQPGDDGDVDERVKPGAGDEAKQDTMVVLEDLADQVDEVGDRGEDAATGEVNQGNQDDAEASDSVGPLLLAAAFLSERLLAEDRGL